MKLSGQTINELAEVLKKNFPQIRFAYIFDPALTDSFNNSSDLDIAVFLKQGSKSFELLSNTMIAVEKTIP